MRVLMTTDAVGGVWQYSLALLRGLVREHDCEVALVCLGDPAEEELRELELAGRVELVRLPLHLEWMRGGQDSIRESVRQVGRLAARWKPDVIHSNQHCFGLLAEEFPTIVVSHSDVLSWTAWQRARRAATVPDLQALRWMVRDDPFLRGYSDLVSTCLAGATAVVSPSRFVAGCLQEIYGVKSAVIHNGLWPDGYAGAAKEPTAVVVGRLWDDAKNASAAVHAAKGLPLEVVMVGPTTGPSGETAHLPAAENVCYLGASTWAEARKAISRASFYLATSSYEPFGLAVLEAALSNCALLANDIPAYRELWGGAALFCGFNDPVAMREALAGLLEAPAAASSWGDAARARAVERFTARRMAADYYALYSDVRRGLPASPRVRE
jgi:glycogen synthase